MSKPRFEIMDSKNGEFYFTLKAPNGEIILTSEMYETKQAAEKGIASVQANASRAQVNFIGEK